MDERPLVIVRGGGDIATGTVQALYRAGFRILILETASPSAIRRYVALSEAVYDGAAVVEDITARLCRQKQDIQAAWQQGAVPLVIDPEGTAIASWRPWAVVDAILAKKNLGTCRAMARHTVALGPGFTAGIDVDVVIETMRGHDLGRMITSGQALPNTGIPGRIGGYGKERVIHSPAEGVFYGCASIGDIVQCGQPIGRIIRPDCDTCRLPDQNGIPVLASLTGLLRGIIRDAYPVTTGFKLADIDPRQDQKEHCFTVSDKARCIGGAVVTALLWRKRQENE